MGGVAGGADNHLLCGEVTVGQVDEPDLDEVGAVLELARDQLARLVGAGDLDDRRIVERQRRAIDERHQRPGHQHARRLGGPARGVAHLEVPHRAAGVEHAGHARGQPHLERGRQAGLVAGHLVGVRHDVVEVGGVGTGVWIAGLKEVHVRVDQARDEPRAAAVDHARALRHLGARRRPDRGDAVSGQDDGAIALGGGGTVGARMDHGDADDGDGGLVRALACRCRRRCRGTAACRSNDERDGHESRQHRATVGRMLGGAHTVTPKFGQRDRFCPEQATPHPRMSAR